MPAEYMHLTFESSGIKELHGLGTFPNSKREKTLSLYETEISLHNWVPFSDGVSATLCPRLLTFQPQNTNNIRNLMGFPRFPVGEEKKMEN